MAAQPIVAGFLADLAVADPIGPAASSAGLLDCLAFDEVSVAGNGVADAAVDDYGLAGQFKLGAAPAAGVVEILVMGVDGHGNYPYPFDGTAGVKTLVDRTSIDNAIVRAFVIDTTNLANGLYAFGPIGVRSLFGGYLPRKLQVAVVHNTGVASHATIGWIYLTPQLRKVGS